MGLSGAVVTPGTLLDAELLGDRAESILLAVHQGTRNRAAAWPGSA
jgi:DNA mismatch repair protein MutS